MSVSNIVHDYYSLEAKGRILTGTLAFTGAFSANVPYQATILDNVVTLVINPIFDYATATGPLQTTLPSDLESDISLTEVITCQIINLGGEAELVDGSAYLNGQTLTIRPSLNYAGTSTFIINGDIKQGCPYLTFLTYIKSNN